MLDEMRYKRQIERLQWLGCVIADYVAEKDRHYGSSWRRRGGSGAFHVIARKWDRIEQACEDHERQYDLFAVFADDDRVETIADDVIDLVGYLLVLMEHMIEVGHVEAVCRYSVDAIPQVVRAVEEARTERDRLVPRGAPVAHVSGSIQMEHPFGFEEEENT